MLRVGRVDGRRASLLDLQEQEGEEEVEEERLIPQNLQHAEVLVKALSGIQLLVQLVMFLVDFS